MHAGNGGADRARSRRASRGSPDEAASLIPSETWAEARRGQRSRPSWGDWHGETCQRASRRPRRCCLAMAPRSAHSQPSSKSVAPSCRSCSYRLRTAGWAAMLEWLRVVGAGMDRQPPHRLFGTHPWTATVVVARYDATSCALVEHVAEDRVETIAVERGPRTVDGARCLRCGTLGANRMNTRIPMRTAGGGGAAAMVRGKRIRQPLQQKQTSRARALLTPAGSTV